MRGTFAPNTKQRHVPVSIKRILPSHRLRMPSNCGVCPWIRCLTLNRSHASSTRSQISSSSSSAQSRFHIGPLADQNSRCSGGAVRGNPSGAWPGTVRSDARRSCPIRFMVEIGSASAESEARYSGVMPPCTNEAAASRNGFDRESTPGPSTSGSTMNRPCAALCRVTGRRGARAKNGDESSSVGRNGTRAVML